MIKTRYYLFILMAFAFAACASDSDLLPIGEGDTDIMMPEETEGVYGNTPMLEYAGVPITRSSLTYDYNTKRLLFSWEDDDVVGVLPEGDNQSQQINYEISEIISPLRARFIQADPGVTHEIQKGNKYFSYKPAIKNYDGSSSEIPVSFDNQYQDSYVNMKDYWDSLKENKGNGDEYKASEVKASKYLPKFNFEVSSGVSPSDNNIYFNYTRLSSFVRLYLKVTEEATYDSIIILNKDADFFIKGTMDISESDAAKSFKPTETRHYVTLRLGDRTEENGVVKYKGFKMWNDENTEDKCDMWSATKEAGYIVAYMAFAPIKLKDLPNQCTLYLLGHDENNNKKYYRAKDPLSRYDIDQNVTLQWAPAKNTIDDPIEVIPVDVEKWKSDMTFDNEGTGTEDW